MLVLLDTQQRGGGYDSHDCDVRGGGRPSGSGV